MEKSLLEICIKKIVESIKLEKKDNLSNSDFDYIVYLIEDKTKIRLSRTTLRRLWENNYNRFPQNSTLDALAQFLDYENWQHFKKRTLDKNGVNRNQGHHSKIHRKLVFTGIIFALVSILILASSMRKKGNSNFINTQNILFECRQTGNYGLPKSVVFKYNIDSCAGDSFFIQQNWRKDTKEPIQKNNYYFTDIYYRPGIHWAKLISNSTEIKYIPVVINSDDWMGILEHGEYQKDFTPLSHNMIMKNGYMTTVKDTFTYPVLKEPYLTPLVFTNVMDFGDIDLDNCMIETLLKAESSEYACNKVSFGYASKNHKRAGISIGPEGCISKLGYRFSETFVSGRNDDLSELSCDITQWTKISIKVENKHVAIYINEKLVLKTSYTESMDGLQRLTYGFYGAGSVDYITIKSLNGECLYQDDFDIEN